ncbi:succinate dehydrogenase, cytochrome b556 subunit [Gulosibacter molinativorax]|nr:succinate dehydrogenase, cytochrome b556 subunit [Gulosibacter molinativorax]QUY63583.1 Succinate dehydrogenase, cytochrome b subunit [Gulosibacter molinativorax]
MSAVQTGTPTAPQSGKKKALGGSLYRGNEGMWSWVLHRITGVAIFFFLLVHVLDSALLLVSPEVYDAVIGAYKTPLMGIGELGLVGAIVYHAFNGLRIILVDFMPGGTRHQKLMFWIVVGVWVVVMVPFAIVHLTNVFSH